MSIDIQNVRFSYGKRGPIVLNDISLKIEDGTISVLLGLNGCGKTTFIKALAGLLKTVSGRILYDDVPLSSLSVRECSRIVAYVPQKIFGIDDVVVSDYLTYGMVNTLRFYQSPDKADREKVAEMSRKLKVDHLLFKKMGEISGGERQIICLCASLLQNTRVLLLDEPTSALDLRNQNLVLSTLKGIATDENKTIILSSHNPNHALFLGSKVMLMDNGRIICYGDAHDVVTIGTLESVYGDDICLSRDLPYDEITFRG